MGTRRGQGRAGGHPAAGMPCGMGIHRCWVFCTAALGLEERGAMQGSLVCTAVCSSHTHTHTHAHADTHTRAGVSARCWVRGVPRLTPNPVSQHPSGTLPASGPGRLLARVGIWELRHLRHSELFHHASMYWVWGTPRDQRPVPQEGFGVPEQDRRGGGRGRDVLGAGSTSGWVACTPGGFRVLEPDGGGGWERVPEEEEAGWGSWCPGAGYWHGYAGVARLGEGTHT